MFHTRYSEMPLTLKCSLDSGTLRVGNFVWILTVLVLLSVHFERLNGLMCAEVLTKVSQLPQPAKIV